MSAPRRLVRAVTPPPRRVAALIALAGALVILLPFAWMLSTSLKPHAEIVGSPERLLPAHPRTDNYVDATTLIPFWRYALNSLIVTVPVVLGTVVSSAAAAFAFARMRGPGLRVMFALVLATIMLPGEVTLLPSFLLFGSLGWVGTYLPLIVPAWLGGGAANIFLLRQYFRTIPPAHDDAARVAGHGFRSILLRVIIPQSWPAISVVAVFTFVDVWNDFLGPVIYLSDEHQYTLPLGLNFFKGVYTTEWGLLMAGSVLALAPCVVVFFLAQRAFTEGVVLTGPRRA